MTEWIVSSSILIFIVIALRTVCKGKISLRLQYAIWSLVLLRLLIPFSFGSTNFSVANLTDAKENQPTTQTVIKIGSNHLPSQNHVQPNTQIVDQHENLIVDTDNPDGSDFTVPETETVKNKNYAEVFREGVIVVWVTGIVLVGLVFLAANIRFRKRVMESRYSLELQKNRLEVYATPIIDTPCLFGIVKPAIYVTSEVANNKTLLRHTMEHEATHYRHGDHIWAVLRCVCAIHWYNPLVWWAAFLSQRDAELACDEATIKRLGEGERAEYGRTLIGMTCQKKANVLITATTMTASKSGIKERILLIAQKPKMAFYTLVIVVLVAAIAVGCTFTGAKKGRPEADDKLAEHLREYSYQQVKNRMDPEEVYGIGSVLDYYLVYCSGMGPELMLYRYDISGEQIVITDRTYGEYTMSGGLSINHIADGEKHIYFGTISDYHWIPENDNRMHIDWKDLVFYDADGEQQFLVMNDYGYLCVLDSPMTDFWVVAQDGSVPLKMDQYLEQGYSINEVTWYSEDNVIPPTESTSGTTDVPDDAPPEGLPELFAKELDDNKVCIAVQPTGLASEGGTYLYIIPEDQAALLEYYQAATSNVEKYFMWDNDMQRSGWWIVYQGQWWQVTESGAMFGTDPETWDGIRINADEAKELYEICDAVVKEAGIAEPVRPGDITEIKSATLEWNGIHTITDAYALNRIEKWISNSREQGSVSCWFTAQLTLELENGQTKTISMATDSCAVWMSEGVAYSYGEISNVGIEGNEEFYSLFATDIIHEKAKEDPDSMIEYWIYTNWRVYSDTYSIDETFALMDMFKKYAVSNPTDWNVSIALTTARGLDGAYAQHYAGVIAALYEADPTTFSNACRQMIPEQDVNNAIDMLAFYWNISQEEVRAILQAK